MSKYFLLLIFLFGSCAPSFAQERKEEVYNSVEWMPQFPGGQTAMLKFISDNLKYPSSAVKDDIQGKVYIEVIVKEDGTLDHNSISVRKGIRKDLDEEAIRIIKAMPRWSGGKQNGKPVAVKMIIPVSFVLQ